MKSKKSFIILALGLVNLVLSFIVINTLESGLPLNVWATVAKDKMCSKQVLLIIPVIVSIMSVLQVLYRTKTMNKTITTWKIVEDALFTFITGVLSLVNWVFIYIGHIYTQTKLINVQVPVIYVIGMFIGVILVALYSTFPINKKGSKIGLRTKETLADADVWRVSNRFNGFTGFVAALVVVIINVYFILNGFDVVYLTIGIVSCILLMFYIPRLYAQMIQRRKEERVVE